MTLIDDIVSDAAIGVGVSDAPDGLFAIREPGCAAAIWRRALPADVAARIEAADPVALPRARIVLRPEDVRRTVDRLCAEAGWAEDAVRDWLVEDIGALADRFAALMQAPALRLRLDVVQTDACRRFHIDAVTARLLCTYRGPGTQYGVSVDGEEPARVFAVPLGAPAVLTGSKWPGAPRSALVHRSPPIEGTGVARLMLVLDPMPAEALA